MMLLFRSFQCLLSVTLITSSTDITVTLSEALFGLDVDTAFKVSGVSVDAYNGQFVVSDVLASDSTGTTQFKYSVSNSPSDPLPTVLVLR